MTNSEQESGRSGQAFVFAALVSLIAFSIYIMPQIDFGSGPPRPVPSLFDLFRFLQTEVTNDLIGFLFVLALITVFLSTPAFFIVLCLALPIFAAFRHFNLHNSASILVSTFVGGWFAGHILVIFMGADPDSIRAIDYQTFILPLSICSLLGGLIFCWMAFWRKPETDQATDGMGNCP